MAMNPPRLLPVLCLALSALLLGACSGLTESDKPAVTSWWLEPYGGGAPAADPESGLPVIVSMSVVPGLDTDRILALTHDSELKPYSGARWVDSLPELAASLVKRSLEASGRFEPVAERTGSSSRPCELNLELRKFYATLDAAGVTGNVSIAISGDYRCGPERGVSIQLHTTVPVHDNRLSVIVAAFQQAMDGSMRDLLQKLP